MHFNRFIELLSKKWTGNISLFEQKDLLNAIEQNPEYAAIAKKIELLYQQPLCGNKANSKTWDAVQKRINATGIVVQEGLGVKNNYRRRRITYIAVAATIILAFFYWGYISTPSPAQEKKNIVSTKKGSRSNLVLPDGTQVWLNANSKITYGENFGKNTREVALTGEAYFDVVKDAGHPFIVHTPTLDVKVLGTAFNVRAYTYENTTQATLLRGLVEVFLKKKNNENITLKPSEKIIVQNHYLPLDRAHPQSSSPAIPEITVLKVAPNPVDSGFLETQWMKTNLSFNYQKLQDIIPLLEQWYDVKFTVSTASLLQRRFSGRFERESLTSVLESFSLASGLKYKIDQDKVLLYK